MEKKEEDVASSSSSSFKMHFHEVPATHGVSPYDERRPRTNSFFFSARCALSPSSDADFVTRLFIVDLCLSRQVARGYFFHLVKKKEKKQKCSIFQNS